MTTYDLVVLAIGVPALVVGVWAGIKMSREKFHVVGLGQDRKEEMTNIDAAIERLRVEALAVADALRLSNGRAGFLLAADLLGKDFPALLDALVETRKALQGLQRWEGCWCDHAVTAAGHSTECYAARRAEKGDQ